MKAIISQWAALALICAVLGSAVSGCAWSIGGKGKDISQSPTLGQQLTDLKVARDQGALTEEEYQAQKHKLMHK